MNFAAGYHDKAINPADEGNVVRDRLHKVSPFLNPTVLAAMKAAGGEIAYDRLLTDRTEEWIGQHPAGALKIAVRHVWEFYFPPRWMFHGGGASVAALKQAMIWAIAFAGFAGLGVSLSRRDWRFLYVAAPLLLLMLPYALGQPVVRYRYPVGGLLVFLAADMTWRASKSLLSRLSWRPPALLGDSRSAPAAGAIPGSGFS